MSDNDSFALLIGRVRAGEEAAATELVQQYEPFIRRTIKMQLRDHRLRRVVDSMDIGQSVLANFFVRASLGQFDLKSPTDLVKLLSKMARNKLATKARKAEVVRRDYPAAEAQGGAEQLVLSEASPSSQVARRELLEAVRQRLSDEERWLAEQRAEGREWADLAAERGGSADALRKKLSRALDRVARELGFEEDKG